MWKISITLLFIVSLLNQAAASEVASTKEDFRLPSEVARLAKDKSVSTYGNGMLTQSVENNVWFDSIDLSLSGDINDNGFFHNLYIRFDADTAYTDVPVFVHYALHRPGYPEVIIHTSSVFHLYGSSAEDWFSIESELLHSIDPGYYDLILRVYDADYGDLLAEISGNDTPALADLALEDLSYDKIIVEEDSGSLHWAVLPLMLLAFWRRQALVRRA